MVFGVVSRICLQGKLIGVVCRGGLYEWFIGVVHRDDL